MAVAFDDADVPSTLRSWWSNPRRGLSDILYRPASSNQPGLSLEGALGALDEAKLPPPDGLVPLTFVDDWSLACLTTQDDEEFGWTAGQVVRWHLDDIPLDYQGALLDIDLDLYLTSLLEELGPAWDRGYRGMKRVAKNYQANFVERNVTPKAYDLRPFQLACQNVIIGLAALRQDVSIDGEAAPYWLTCEAPHVATYEGSRTLSALMLCDAFQSGGTMEVSFKDHPEKLVPASLRRYARTLEVDLGAELPGGASISPTEARALFVAVTPMPNDLRLRAGQLIDAGVLSAERLCYTLLSAVWSAASLDFLAACASPERLASILGGGCDVFDRPNRAPEMELTRAAVLLDTFITRVDAKDSAAVDGQNIRLFEDTRHGVKWRVDGDTGAVEVIGLPAGPVAWHRSLISTGRLIVMPRAHPIAEDFDLARRMQASEPAPGVPVALLTCAGSPADDQPGVAVLKCPVRLAEIDLQIERSLLSSTLGRA